MYSGSLWSEEIATHFTMSCANKVVHNVACGVGSLAIAEPFVAATEVRFPCFYLGR